MAFVARTCEMSIHKAEVEKHRRRSRIYVEDEFLTDNEVK